MTSSLSMPHFDMEQQAFRPNEEMVELSSWLEDVFPKENEQIPQDATSGSFRGQAPQTHSSMFNTEMDKEIEAIISSEINSFDDLNTMHAVSPSPPEVPSSRPLETCSSAIPTIVNLDQVQPSTPLKRGFTVVSQSSEEGDIPIPASRPTKRPRHSRSVSDLSSEDDVLSSSVSKIQSQIQETSIKAVATKKQTRREKNREHAKKCRSKKREHFNNVEKSVIALRKENQKLRRLVHSKFGEEQAKAMVKDRIRTSADKMIEALKNPSKKPLSNSVVHYLQSLRCDIQLYARRP